MSLRRVSYGSIGIKVWEETGFDVTDKIRDEDYVEQTIKDQRIRLYIIKGVSESTVFEPQTRKEISVSLLIGSERMWCALEYAVPP